jgi:hypothetical protein
VYYDWVFVGGPGISALYKIIINAKEPATPIYGQLNPLEFTNKEVSADNATYRLNTKNGRLPGKFPYKMNVYKFKLRAYSYLAGDNAIKNAAYMGYGNSDLVTDLKGTVYRWRKLDMNSFLEIDINSGRFYADSDMVRNSAIMQKNRLNEEVAKKNAVAFFRKLERMDDMYSVGNHRVTFGYVGGNKLVQTTAAKDIQFSRIDLYRSINEFPILGPDPKVGLLNTFFAINTDKKLPLYSYPKANAFYREIETTTKASYPIIDISTAWDAVKEGNGVITSVIPYGSSIFDKPGKQTIEEILVDNIYLAYYENNKDQTYLQPIYVFEAKYKSMGTQGGELTIYIPAVSGEFVKPIIVE